MTTFAYKALGGGESVVKGEVLAIDRSDALRKLRSLELLPLDIWERGAEGARRRGAGFGAKRVRKEEMMVALREMSVMLRAGIPILRALRILIEANKDKPIGDVFSRIYDETKKGESLAGSLEKQKKHFSHLIINMVRTGEKSGRLPDVLLSVSQDLEHSLLVATEIRNALAYPAFLLTMSALALFFIFTFVIPRFTDMISKLNVELPAYSRFVLGAGNFMKAHLVVVCAVLLSGGFLLVFLLRKKAVRYFLNRAALRLPIVKNFILEVELSRFAHALAVLLNSGVEIINSLRMSADSMGNAFLRKRFAGVSARLKRGESLHASIRDIGYFPRLAVHMIEVGEETGKLPEILEEISELFLQKFRSTMKRMISLLEPVIITLVGLVIGFIVISLFSAIMSMNEVKF
jgi:general secretion pathway protein F